LCASLALVIPIQASRHLINQLDFANSPIFKSFLLESETQSIQFSLDLFVFISVCILCFCILFDIAYEFYYCERGWVDLMGLKPNP